MPTFNSKLLFSCFQYHSFFEIMCLYNTYNFQEDNKVMSQNNFFMWIFQKQKLFTVIFCVHSVWLIKDGRNSCLSMSTVLWLNFNHKMHQSSYLEQSDRYEKELTKPYILKNALLAVQIRKRSQNKDGMHSWQRVSKEMARKTNERTIWI